MKNIFVLFFIILTFSIQLFSLDFSRKEMVDLSHNDKLMILEANSHLYVWVVYKPQAFWASHPFGIYHIDAENPQPGNLYDFTYVITNSNLEDVTYSHSGFLLFDSLNATDNEPEGIVQSHLVVNVFSIPGYESAILLENNQIWLIPNFQNTFKIGDEVEILKASKDLVYLVKQIKWGDTIKELLMPSKKLSNGIYQIQ